MNSWLASPASTPLRGHVRVPSDKSITHRGIMLGGLATGTTRIDNPLLGEDARSTMAAMTAFGACIEKGDGWLEVTGNSELIKPATSIDCGNAGTLMRLLAGLVCGRNVSCTLDGDASLRQRPMRRVTGPLTDMGARISASATGTPPLTIDAVAQLQRIEFQPPQASAQVKSAVLLAGLCAKQGARVIEPLPTRDHTELMLPLFGAQIRRDGAHIEVAPCLQLTSAHVLAPADISSAAFFLVAASIVPGSDLLLEEVCINPTRTGIITILRAMGADIELVNKRRLGQEQVADLRVRHAPLHGVTLGAKDIPAVVDELPSIFVAASVADGQFQLRAAEELRTKETDRLAAMTTALQALGAIVTEYADGLDIQGGTLHGGKVASCGDHRIAMAMAAAALTASDTVTITDTDNVATSFPGFSTLAGTCGWQVEKLSS